MKRFILLFLLLCGILSSCSGPLNPFAKSAGKEINPIEENVTWIYKVTNMGSATYNNVDRIECWYSGMIETYMGDSAWVFNKNAVDAFGSTVWSYNNIYRAQDDFGYYSYGTDLNNDNPTKFLEYPVYEGKKWTSKKINDGEYYFDSYDSLEGIVDGQFSTNGYDDCWRVKVTLLEKNNSSGLKYDYIIWYKEGVGVIKDSQWVFDDYGLWIPAGVVMTLDTIIE